MNEHEVTVEQEIANPFHSKPHVLLLGAGASKAALPNGDKHGRPVPLLRDIAEDLKLDNLFPEELKELATKDFESAYSKLFELGVSEELNKIDSLVRGYFSKLELPDEPNLYDAINLSMRDKDVILTFNWDPFLMQSRIRLAKLGITTSFPQLFFLHGNVTVGFCEEHNTSGIAEQPCSRCRKPFKPSKLLYPVEHKDYQSDNFIKREWEAAQYYLKNCSVFTVFGYSAPVTDKEAIGLLKDGWGDVNDRSMEQTEIINRPGSDHDALSETWSPFIHTHHVDILDSFYDSFIAKHPRRSVEAYWNQYWEAKFISNNPVPQNFSSLSEMAEWFKPLVDAEKKS
ncbi:hypothetical protein KC952_00075 [Candidatus Saccharibacteria bacterium]|nr:hypothetical protein [Candidatus Saccharibacteria bacterium]